MEFTEFTTRSIVAIEKAMLKHPGFVKKISNLDAKQARASLERVREVNTAQELLGNETLEGILLEEVGELIQAAVEGDKKAAIEECFDLIAVAWRTIELLEKKGGRR